MNQNKDYGKKQKSAGMFVRVCVYMREYVLLRVFAFVLVVLMYNYALPRPCRLSFALYDNIYHL